LKAWRRLASIERTLLIVLLLIGTALFGFFRIASEVSEGDTMAVDRAILLGLRSTADPAIPVGPKWLPEAMTDLTAFGSATGLVLVCAAIIFYLLLARRPRTALFVLAATAGGTALGSLLKAF
jgi:undecaprenyl-diphosphatase